MDLHARHPEYRFPPTGFMTGEGMYHVTDKDAMGWAKICGFLTSPPYNLELAGVICENLDSDDIVSTFVDTPWDSELRNTGLLGGSWYGVRHSRDEWWNQRPLPELDLAPALRTPG